ncbi:MAG: D-glycero-beta-D-manno-heptose-7-phosphate kinase [Flavobacteriales bacterium]|nr:D-glycero-beta-D-manno-heptose-7-phosphate kinase [Flavobacteriales bacterium]
MTSVAERFDAFARARVLVLGDVMLDAYLWGRVDRISPEAPVPVVRVTHHSERLGGAANVALNLRALGARPIVLSVLGNDAYGDRTEALFLESGLTTAGLVRSAQRRTTVKTRVISGHQHIVRVDEEEDTELGEVDARDLLKRLDALIDQERPQVIVFEDYDKGCLTPAVIRQVTERARQHGIPCAVDPKKRNFMRYERVDLFKPNLKELREGLKMDVSAKDPDQVRNAVLALEKALGNTTSLLTLSEHGVYVHRSNEEHFLPAHHRSIADVSGAGDTVIAVAALLLAQGADARTLAAWANLAGGLVCEQVGVVPIDRDLFRRECEALEGDA